MARDAIIAAGQADRAEAALLKARLTTALLEIERIKMQLAVLRRQRYGQSSERLDRDIDQLELQLEDLETDCAEQVAATAESPEPNAASKPRCPAAGRKPLPAHLPREATPDKADHLEPSRDFLQHLGHVLAKASELAAVAAAAHHLRLMHHGLARQMVGQRLAHRLPARLGRTPGCAWIRDRGLALGLALLQVFQPQLQVDDVRVEPLGRTAILLAAQRGQLRPQVLDLDGGRAKLRPRHGQLVPKCGDFLVGRAACQVHAAKLADELSLYNHKPRKHEPDGLVLAC